MLYNYAILYSRPACSPWQANCGLSCGDVVQAVVQGAARTMQLLPGVQQEASIFASAWRVPAATLAFDLSFATTSASDYWGARADREVTVNSKPLAYAAPDMCACEAEHTAACVERRRDELTRAARALDSMGLVLHTGDCLAGGNGGDVCTCPDNRGAPWNAPALARTAAADIRAFLESSTGLL
jgi:hypothetical protein